MHLSRHLWASGARFLWVERVPSSICRRTSSHVSQLSVYVRLHDTTIDSCHVTLDSTHSTRVIRRWTQDSTLDSCDATRVSALTPQDAILDSYDATRVSALDTRLDSSLDTCLQTLDSCNTTPHTAFGSRLV